MPRTSPPWDAAEAMDHKVSPGATVIVVKEGALLGLSESPAPAFIAKPAPNTIDKESTTSDRVRRARRLRPARDGVEKVAEFNAIALMV